MVSTRIELRNLDELRRAVDPVIFTEEVEATVREAAIFTEGRVRERSFATHDTSATARSWASEVRGMSATVYSPLMSALIEEEGRRPGGRMPPPGALRGWAQRHGFPTNSGALFMLARSIARRGRPGRFYLRAATKDLEERMPSMLVDTARRIQARFEAAFR